MEVGEVEEGGGVGMAIQRSEGSPVSQSGMAETTDLPSARFCRSSSDGLIPMYSRTSGGSRTDGGAAWCLSLSAD